MVARYRYSFGRQVVRDGDGGEVGRGGVLVWGVKSKDVSRVVYTSKRLGPSVMLLRPLGRGSCLILVAGTRKSSWNEVSRAWRCSRGESYKQVVQGLINALSLKRGEAGVVTQRFLLIYVQKQHQLEPAKVISNLFRGIKIALLTAYFDDRFGFFR